MSTFNHTQIAPLIKQFEEAKTKSKAEERAALKKIPTFADVWENYLERKSTKNQPKKKCTTSSCDCGSTH